MGRITQNLNQPELPVDDQCTTNKADNLSNLLPPSPSFASKHKPAANEEKHRAAEQDYWNRQVRVAKWLNVITVLGILTGSVGLYFLRDTLRATQQSAEAALRSVELAEIGLVADVYVNNLTGTDYGKPTCLATLFFLNTGKTDAYNLTVSPGWVINPDPGLDPFEEIKKIPQRRAEAEERMRRADEMMKEARERAGLPELKESDLPEPVRKMMEQRRNSPREIQGPSMPGQIPRGSIPVIPGNNSVATYIMNISVKTSVKEGDSVQIFGDYEYTDKRGNSHSRRFCYEHTPPGKRYPKGKLETCLKLQPVQAKK